MRETGLSVPDAQMLIRLSEVLECPVSRLLGSQEESCAAADTDAIAQQLERINEQLAVKNRRSRRIWKAAVILLALFLAAQLLLMVLSAAAFDTYRFRQASVVVMEEEVPEQP